MPQTSRPQFRAAALASELITQDQLDLAENALRESMDISNSELVEVADDELASYLVEKGILTGYQAEQLKAGRKRFKLGKYVITDWIGQGGMGMVYRGVHEVMGREAAVKVLPPDRTTPATIESFNREIKMQAQMDHPNLVRVYDADKDANAHFLVTEFVPGMDLRRLIREQGGKPLSMQQAASIIMQAALGLDYAHTQGLIHRDVKPGNILVTPDGIAKLSDLGLSGYMDQTDEDPRANKIVGTPDYLSPEQIRRPAEIGPPSDVYSMGCTLYYAVTGKVPYPGGTVREKTRRHLEETPWHPRRFNPEISEEFVEVIADMMEKDPERRLQTAGEVAQRLEPWASQTPVITPLQRTGPWLPPPLPAYGDDQDTDGFEDSQGGESISQSSMGTTPNASANQDTIIGRNPKPVYHIPRQPVMTTAQALTVAVPLAFAAGAMVGYWIAHW